MQFTDIQLVDSFTNEKDSHGFIKFEVSTMDSFFTSGQLIENQVAIFFDFNDPILTNTVKNYYLCKDTIIEVYASICEGEEFEGYGNNGVFTDYFESLYGCDSTRVLYLEILNEDHKDCMEVNNENLIEKLNTVNIIPNPAKDFFEIVSDKLNISSIQVFNSNGSAVKDFRNIHGRKNFRVDTSLYCPGIYFVEIQHENGEAAYKKVFIVD